MLALDLLLPWIRLIRRHRPNHIASYAVGPESLVSPGVEELPADAQFRDRGDAENNFDEGKNQWGWLGFTTHDHARSEMMTFFVALVYNWWRLFTRLPTPGKHAEAITSRPLLLHAIGRKTSHSHQSTLAEAEDVSKSTVNNTGQSRHLKPQL